MPTTVSNSAASVNPDIPVATIVRSGNVYQEVVQGLVNQPYDEIVLSYTGTNLTGVVYKLATVTVATLTLGYTGSNLTSVVRS
jgi:TATA-box binding protein (TBP) (component of TFIID and TFIIIB)